MFNLIYNPVIDLGVVLALLGILLAALRGIRRFAWLVALGFVVGVGGWLLPGLHFPKATSTALREVSPTEIKTIAAGKAPASELTPQYVASIKLHSDTPGFNSFNGAANAIANSPMAHNAKWVAETAVLAELEGNDMLANALGYSGSGVVGARPGVVLTGVKFQASLPSKAVETQVHNGPGDKGLPPQQYQKMYSGFKAQAIQQYQNMLNCSPTMTTKVSAFGDGSVSASGVIELARAGSTNDPLVGCNQNLPFRVTLLHLQITP